MNNQVLFLNHNFFKKIFFLKNKIPNQTILQHNIMFTVKFLFFF